jgi:prefoldin subunit 5
MSEFEKNPRPIGFNKELSEANQWIAVLDNQISSVGRRLGRLEEELKILSQITAKIPNVEEQVREARRELSGVRSQLERISSLESQISSVREAVNDSKPGMQKVFLLEGKFTIAMVIISAILTGLVGYTVSQAVKSTGSQQKVIRYEAPPKK